MDFVIILIKLKNSGECRYFCLISHFNENPYNIKPLNKFIVCFWQWDIILYDISFYFYFT